MEWLIIVIVAVATALALALVFRIQRARLQRSFRLELVNEGNVRSRYQLRAESEAGLRFRFVLDGDDLPQEAYQDPRDLASDDARLGRPGSDAPAADDRGPRHKAGAAGQSLGQAAGLAALAADVLTTLGTLLPHSMGGPLLRRASQLQMGRIRIAQARRVSGQVAGLGGSARTASRDSRPVAATERVTPAAGPVVAGPRYAETPFVRPGQTLAIDLLVRAAAAVQAQAHSFRIISRSIEQENASLLIEEGSVRFIGGFWSRRYLPYLVILATGIVVLFLALWISGSSAPF